jgi:lysophospholipase L1-like esterase
VEEAAGLKYLALGDSYTIGEGVHEQERFPFQLSLLLAKEDIHISTITYIATTGWTSDELTKAIDANNAPADYDLVTLLIGVNDQYRQLDLSAYSTCFSSLILRAIALAGNRPSRVFVLSIPDYSVTPFVAREQKATVREEIERFNLKNRQITTEAKIGYVDIAPLSREASVDHSLIAKDGLHPSGKQYQKWAAALAPVMKRALM